MRLDEHFNTLVPAQVSDEHDGPVRAGRGLVEDEAVRNEVGDDLIGTPSGQSGPYGDAGADRDERIHVSAAGAPADGVRGGHDRADDRPVPGRRAADASEWCRAWANRITAHHSLGGADVAVIMLGEHHGYAGAAGGPMAEPMLQSWACRRSNRWAPRRSPMALRNPGSTDRHGVRPLWVAVETGQMLGRRPDPVDGDVPVE